MARTSNADALDRFRWRVSILSPAGTGFKRAGFSTCSTPAVTIRFKEYPEGGSHMVPRQIHDGATFKPITLRRGVISRLGTDDFAQWIDDVYKALNPENGVKEAQGSAIVQNYRKTLLIEHFNRNGNVIKKYTLINCVPVFYEPASDFDALDESSVSVETLSLSYEGFEEESVNDIQSLANRFRGLF